MHHFYLLFDSFHMFLTFLLNEILRLLKPSPSSNYTKFRWKVCCAVLCSVAQWYPTLCDPMDCSLPGASVHGDSPDKNTRVGCHALLQGIFQTQGSNPGLPHCRQILSVSQSVQSFSHIWLFATPWTAARQASLSITSSQSLLKLMSIELVMTSNHLILCRPLLFLLSTFPSVRVFYVKKQTTTKKTT